MRETKREVITSRSNPLMAHIRRLASSRAHRREAGVYLGEGRKLLAEALRSGYVPHTVVCTPGTELPELPDGVRLVETPPDVLRTVSALETPPGVLFLGPAPSPHPPECLSGRRYLVLEGIQDPGNLGTILRTADAFQVDGVFLLDACADPFGPKTLRASMGAAFRCPAWRCSLEELLSLLASAAIPLWGAALHRDAVAVQDVDFTRAAILLGNEGSGLSEKALAACTSVVRIPMSPHCESLNVASAAAVLLWEGYRGGNSNL